MSLNVKTEEILRNFQKTGIIIQGVIDSGFISGEVITVVS